MNKRSKASIKQGFGGEICALIVVGGHIVAIEARDVSVYHHQWNACFLDRVKAVEVLLISGVAYDDAIRLVGKYLL